MSEVSLVRCEDYDRQRVDSALRSCLERLGGMGLYVRPGDKVVIKPNLLRGSKPEAAIVTHPEVVRAAVRLAQEAGGIVTIIDSPGGPANENLMRRAYNQAGWDAVAAETGATLSYNVAAVQVPSPEGKLIKRFDLLEEVTKADCVITLPKLKTHGLVRFTGATKILFGVVPGMLKMGYHTKLQTAAAFSEMLLDLLGLVKPRLAIMDAVVGMEGNGPAAGNPRQIGVSPCCGRRFSAAGPRDDWPTLPFLASPRTGSEYRASRRRRAILTPECSQPSCHDRCTPG
jgi:uncharacterized protein (DUF362 family)